MNEYLIYISLFIVAVIGWYMYFHTYLHYTRHRKALCILISIIELLPMDEDDRARIKTKTTSIGNCFHVNDNTVCPIVETLSSVDTDTDLYDVVDQLFAKVRTK
jgi:hypothetical protein